MPDNCNEEPLFAWKKRGRWPRISAMARNALGCRGTRLVVVVVVVGREMGSGGGGEVRTFLGASFYLRIVCLHFLTWIPKRWYLARIVSKWRPMDREYGASRVHFWRKKYWFWSNICCLGTDIICPLLSSFESFEGGTAPLKMRFFS